MDDHPDTDMGNNTDSVNINIKLDYFRKKFVITSVKYTPSILGIFCAFKLILFSYLHLQPNIINIINVIMLTLVLIVVYLQGKAFKFCDKHRNICYTTFFGHCYYIFYCIGIVNFNVEAIIIYSLLLVSMTIVYYLQTKSSLI